MTKLYQKGDKKISFLSKEVLFCSLRDEKCSLFRFCHILFPILKNPSHVRFLNPRNECEESPLHQKI